MRHRTVGYAILCRSHTILGTTKMTASEICTVALMTILAVGFGETVTTLWESDYNARYVEMTE